MSNNLTRDRSRSRLGVIAIPLFVAVGFAAKLPEAILPIGTDTGMYATYARMILNGARPYVDFYDVHPPLTYYYWVLVESIAGTDWSRTCIGAWGTLAPQPCISLLAHALDLALTCVAAGIAYAIARRLGFGALVGLTAGVFVVWFANASMISMEGSNPTKLTLVPSTFAVYAYIRSLEGSRSASAGWAMLCGAAAVLAGLAKQPGLMTLVALVAYTLPGAIREVAASGRLWRGDSGHTLAPSDAGAVRRLMWMVGGGVAVGAVTGVLLWRIGSLGGFLDEAWKYNAERFLIGYWQTPAGLASPATRIDRVITQAAALLFLCALVGGVSLWFADARCHRRLLLVWGIFSLVAIAGFREFAQVVPSLALLAGVGIGRLWQAASRDGLGLGAPLAGKLALVALLGAVFLLSSSFQLIELRRAWFERGPRGTPSDPERIATYLRQTAPPGPLFAWGNAGQIYALSGRQPATRFVIAEFTNTTSPRPQLSRTEVIDDLHVRPPAIIVVDPHTDEPGLELGAFPQLAAMLSDCYRKVTPDGTPVGDWGIYVATADAAAAPSSPCAKL